MQPKKPIDFSRLLTVGEVAHRAGVPVSTIHFYESKGLIASTQRRQPAPVRLGRVALHRRDQGSPAHGHSP